MVRIYIRHAPKEYSNGKSETFKHDPPITEDGREAAKVLARNLIKHYGVPVYIVCSPYRRTRETAEAMLSVLPTAVPCVCDVLLSEYLGNHADVNLDITPETAEYQPPHPETFRQFEERIRRHCVYLDFIDEVSQSVWFITHGIAVTQVTRLAGPQLIRGIEPLGCVCVKKTSSGRRAELIS